MLEKPVRIRSLEHLKHVRTFSCVACKAPGPSTAHHLTIAQPKARGLKAGDQWSLPLCDRCHKELHARGDERAYWADIGIDPISLAESLWANSPAFEEEQIGVRPRRLPQRRSNWREARR
jgi:hypothetical protein